MTNRISTHRAKRRLRVGDRGLFVWGLREVMVEVVEDRGPLGGGGRQLVRISLPVEPFEEPFFTETPAENIRLVD